MYDYFYVWVIELCFYIILGKKELFSVLKQEDIILIV